jgi:hypothetical protein
MPKTRRKKGGSSYSKKRHQNEISNYFGQKNSEGQKHGIGLIKYNNGSTYYGQWENNKWKNGKYDSKNFIYEGEFKNGLFHGNGKYDSKKDNFSYEGEFENGHFIHGEYKAADGYVYTGGFINGKKEGLGFSKWNNGDEFFGQFLNDKRNGEGFMILSNKVVFKGTWKDDNLQGMGICISPFTNEEYECSYEDAVSKTAPNTPEHSPSTNPSGTTSEE